MNMFEKMSTPPFQTAEQASTYLASEIKRALPSGWHAKKAADDALSWTVEPVGSRTTFYGVRITADLKEVRITFGNTDAGPMQLHHFVAKALIVPSGVLSQFGFGACLRHAMTFEPNQCGLT